MTDHERIWLEPEDGSDPDTGRMWCQHPAPGLGDDRTWTEYVRADLVAAREAAAREEGKREGIEAAAKWHDAESQRIADEAERFMPRENGFHERSASAIRALLPAKEPGHE